MTFGISSTCVVENCSDFVIQYLGHLKIFIENGNKNTLWFSSNCQKCLMQLARYIGQSVVYLLKYSFLVFPSITSNVSEIEMPILFSGALLEMSCEAFYNYIWAFLSQQIFCVFKFRTKYTMCKNGFWPRTSI